jgi:hypothetical protein
VNLTGLYALGMESFKARKSSALKLAMPQPLQAVSLKVTVPENRVSSNTNW